jgi:hypothetical protein
MVQNSTKIAVQSAVPTHDGTQVKFPRPDFKVACVSGSDGVLRKEKGDEI